MQCVIFFSSHLITSSDSDSDSDLARFVINLPSFFPLQGWRSDFDFYDDEMICDAFKQKHISHLLCRATTSSRSPWNWNIWWSWREERKGIRRRLLADNFENWNFFPVSPSLRSFFIHSLLLLSFSFRPHTFALHPSLWWKINLMNDSALSRGVSSNYNIVHLSSLLSFLITWMQIISNFFSPSSSSSSLMFTGN